MSESLRLTNRLQLTHECRVVALVEGIVSALGVDASPSVEWHVDDRPLERAGGWLVAHDGAECGFAIFFDDINEFTTPVRRWVGYAHCAERLGKLFAKDGSHPVVIVQRNAPPAQWRLIPVRARERLIRCAVSHDVATIVAPMASSRDSFGAIRIALEGRVGLSDRVAPGLEYQTRLIRAYAPSIQWSGVLAIGKQGEVSMVSDMNEGGVFEDSCLPVRIELGEIELSVAEIANLRKGGVLEVDAPGQLRCFMRVGSSIIAEGIVRIKSEGFSICIEKIVMPR